MILSPNPKVQLLRSLIFAVSSCTKCDCLNISAAGKRKKEEVEVKKVLKELLGRNPTEQEVMDAMEE